MSKEAELDVRSSECDPVPAEPSRDPESPRPPPPPPPPPGQVNQPTGGQSIPSSSRTHPSLSSSSSSGGGGGVGGQGGVSIVSSAEGAGSSMQFSTRPPSAEQPGFMGTWQQQSTDSNLLYRMSQQGAVTRLPLKGDRSTMGRDLEEVQWHQNLLLSASTRLTLRNTAAPLNASRENTNVFNVIIIIYCRLLCVHFSLQLLNLR
ncbi:actin nucleation-promoting factor WAS-like [Poeciliopsis prolifica]|uniref:actin nucleation-promoting factor WAS-like n=1 Tax=Poeciliopsis prolifica TaxID=188132 RepID=UPI0024146672|nr:actin nucleation-promoting factor WAS-like [Poeciliopsis prolifica]